MANRRGFSKPLDAPRGFLGRLLRDRAGNTLALVAAGLIPLLGLIGGGVDMSRIYLTKARMQQACDAGALAGRRMMSSGAWSANSNAANTAAVAMYNGNFQADSYGSTSTAPTFTESSGTVTGTASASLPMTVMKIFGQTAKTITVTCSTKMEIPNTDVMFVLDTTGSMADCPDGSACSSNSNSKIAGLKKAVKCFYEALAKIDTTADCGSTPTGSNNPGVQLRFGFMPYATNVNVGKLLPNDFLANSWPYQTREPTVITMHDIQSYGPESSPTYGATTSTNPATTTWVSRTSNLTVGGTTYTYSFTGVTNATCAAKAVPVSSDTNNAPVAGVLVSQTTPVYPDSTQTRNYTSAATAQTRTSYRYLWTKTGNNNSTTGTCVLQTGTGAFTTTTAYTTTRTVNWVDRLVNGWNYLRRNVDVSGLKAGGSTWRNSFTVPLGTAGANRTITWDGCIEERSTIKESSYEPIDGLLGAAARGANDLNIDLVPDQGNADTLWGPALDELIFARAVTTNWNQMSYPAEMGTTNNYYNTVPYYCPIQAKKLQIWSTATSFETYVNSLVASGNTYHDIGILWGARFMSPTGIFASENAFTVANGSIPGGGTIQRHMIFMSDGETLANNTDYAAYGFPWLDRRETDEANVPSSTDLANQVNARYAALCTTVKNKGITLWVISYGTDVSQATRDRMKTCASTPTDEHFFNATDSALLIANFKQIASNISQLRLTQ